MWRSGCEYQGKNRPVAGCLIPGEKEPGLETSRGNAAVLHYTLLEGEGIRCHSVSALAGCGAKHRLNASDRSHLSEAQSLFRTDPIPEVHLWRARGIHNCSQHVLSVKVFRGKQELTFILPRDPTLSCELPGKHGAGLKSDIACTKLFRR